ncbi:MAG: hypothetical protein OJF58_003835 [Enhydrobacter sp.]|nr:MAG: hypothetical protein OJF58_003835 [Enhydrobacter sp.]
MNAHCSGGRRTAAKDSLNIIVQPIGPNRKIVVGEPSAGQSDLDFLSVGQPSSSAPAAGCKSRHRLRRRVRRGRPC